MKLTSFVFTLAVILYFSSCSDPTLVGAGLLEDDRADVGFSDTLSISARPVTRDSIRTYSPFTSSQLPTYLFGSLNDPLFGRSTASIYAQVYPENNSPNFGENTVVDSIVLVLPYDIERFYAKTAGEVFGIDVYQLAEAPLEDNDYFSNQELEVAPMPIGSALVTVSVDSLEFTDYEGTDTVTVKIPHCRIPVDDAIASLLVGLESDVYESDSLFFDAFEGIHLRPGTENEGMLSFDLLSEHAGIYLYYRDSLAGKPKRFLYDFDIQPTVRFVNFQHNYEGAPVAAFLEEPKLGDSLVFIQGMTGLEARLEIPNVTALQGLVVNKAELEVYVASLEEDEPGFEPIQQLILNAPDSYGELFVVEDIALIQAQRRNLQDFFGGTPQTGANGAPTLYRMNITAHIQGIIDGERENVLYIAPLEKARTAARTILYGPGHPQYGIKLKLAFTKL
ncbi:MAG: DUF4270 family protein [Phaeodactylibacter sp.]|nr:DUF4270 family protein [Phaeodactylibacter sp.]